MKHICLLNNKEELNAHKEKFGLRPPLAYYTKLKETGVIPKRKVKIHYNPNVVIDDAGTTYLDYYSTQTLFPQDKLEILSNGDYYESFKINGVEQAKPLVSVETEYGPVYRDNYVVLTPLTPDSFIEAITTEDVFTFNQDVDTDNWWLVLVVMMHGEVAEFEPLPLATCQDAGLISVDGNKLTFTETTDFGMSLKLLFYSAEPDYSMLGSNTYDLFINTNSEIFLDVALEASRSGWDYSMVDWTMDSEISLGAGLTYEFKEDFNFPITVDMGWYSAHVSDSDDLMEAFIPEYDKENRTLSFDPRIWLIYISVYGFKPPCFYDMDGNPYEFKVKYKRGGMDKHVYVDKNIGEFDVEAIILDKLYVDTFQQTEIVDECMASYVFDGVKGYIQTPIFHPYIQIAAGTSYDTNLHHLLPCFTRLELPNGIFRTAFEMFEEIASYSKVKLPKTLKYIAPATFISAQITEIEIPSNVEEIGKGAFRGSNITSIKIPNSVKTIDENAFQYCTNLKNVVVGDSVITIRRGCFAYNTALTSVTLGRNVDILEGEAFYGCDNLSSITFLGEVAPTCQTVNDKTPFTNISPTGMIYVPYGSDYYSLMTYLPSGWTIEYI